MSAENRRIKFRKYFTNRFCKKTAIFDLFRCIYLLTLNVAFIVSDNAINSKYRGFSSTPKLKWILDLLWSHVIFSSLRIAPNDISFCTFNQDK